MYLFEKDVENADPARLENIRQDERNATNMATVNLIAQNQDVLGIPFHALYTTQRNMPQTAR